MSGRSLVEFLTARLNEDEAAARDAGVAYHVRGDGVRTPNDPARVLREVEAKRAIVAWHMPDEAGEFCFDDIGLRGDKWAFPCPTLRHLAALYADHPDYDESWKP